MMKLGSLLAATISGCSMGLYDPRGVEVTIVVEDPQDLGNAQGGAYEWSHVCGTNITAVPYDSTIKQGYFDDRDGRKRLVIPLHHVKDIHDVPEFQDTPASRLGETHHDFDGVPTFVMTDDRSTPKQKIALMAHEFGHVLGIHAHTPDGLMASALVNPVWLYVTPELCKHLEWSQANEMGQ